eukprot:g7449.t1
MRTKLVSSDLRSTEYFGCPLNTSTSIRTRRSISNSISCKSTNDSLLVAITGATGLIGSRLVSRLISEGNRVKVLTRFVDRAKSKLPYPGIDYISTPNWNEAICGCDGVVNLAGEPIATRWSPSIKEEIKRSRVDTTKRVSEAINLCSEDSRPKVLVNASAIGYYGTNLTESMVESSPNGDDYLAEICREWEAAANEAKSRVVILRTGLVLAKEGGVLGRMVPVFQVLAGGPLGSGQQWVSWIHREDLVNLILRALTDPNFKGSYNATAPNPVKMGEFCAELGKAIGKPSWLPVPEFALQTLLGEGAMLVVEGQRVLPSKTQSDGFEFQFPEVSGALSNIL